jgi:Domain of unknown function (DUF4404)
MPDPASPSVAQVRAVLPIIAQLLREVNPLGPEAQAALADLVDELGTALDADTPPSAAVAHLTESAAHLVQAVGRRDEPGLLGKARDRMEAAVTAAEAEAPTAAGLTRRLLETLSNLGI